MKNTRRYVIYSILGCATLLLLSGTSARAQSTSIFTLSNLIAGTSGTTGTGGIQIGDKLFTNWLYSFNGIDMPSASLVNVQGVTVAGNYGIQFTSNWHSNPGNGAQSALIDYRVSVTDPNWRISDIHLDGDPTVVGGNGQASVVESASEIVGHTSVLPHTLSIFDLLSGASHTSQLNDSANTIGLYSALDIEKTINVSSDSGTTNASITHIQQTFSQASAPEPGTLAFLALGGTMVLVRRRKH